MAKTIVIKEPDGDRVPFFRGILVQSLVTSGLAFDDACDVAQAVRDGLKDITELSSRDLRERVAALLEKKLGVEARKAYENKPQIKSEIIVHTRARSAFFSVGILSHSLEACAIAPEMAMGGARAVYDTLKNSGHREIDHRALRRVIYRCLTDHYSMEAANRYLSWRRFEESGKPLILLIGGVTGSGKSTISSELAYRLGIAGMQSTDIMREIIRSYLPPQVIPTLMYSSFEAWRGLPFPRNEQTLRERSKLENPVITGFLSQLNTMKPALEATVVRALKEEQDIILEGVHVVPTHLDLEEANEKAIVVPIMLATMKKKLLRQYLKSRGREKSGRKASHYLDNLDDIWELQSYLLNEADVASIPIIPNPNTEKTISEVLNVVSNEVMKHFPAHKEYAGDEVKSDM
jgi:2-phosphoglycerate kinase